MYQPTINNVIQNYEIIPRDSATDGGYASLANRDHAQKAGIANIVFNKVVGSMQNIVSSLNMETRLKNGVAPWRPLSRILNVALTYVLATGKAGSIFRQK